MNMQRAFEVKKKKKQRTIIDSNLGCKTFERFTKECDFVFKLFLNRKNHVILIIENYLLIEQ